MVLLEEEDDGMVIVLMMMKRERPQPRRLLADFKNVAPDLRSELI